MRLHKDVTVRIGRVAVRRHVDGPVQSDAIGQVLKGRAEILVQDGKPDRKKMESNQISEKDLLEEARLNGNIDQMSEIRIATIERNGQVSIIPDK